MRSLAFLFCVSLLTVSFDARADDSRGMQLGTNFWNIGWHKPNDCFNDWKKVQGDNPWNPQFLKEISIYRVLRFMDWDLTNNSTRRAWGERNGRENPNQNPVAYEWMIDLCNRNHSDLWLTLPHLAVSRATGDRPCDYALRLCILVKTGVDVKQTDLAPMLDQLATMTDRDFIAAGGVKTCQPLKPDLKLYLEYSNETWNGIFKQSGYCADEGQALQLDANRATAGYRYHSWAALRIFRAAELIFGRGSHRVVRVLAGFTVNPTVSREQLKTIADERFNPWHIKADAIATAPYFGHNVDGTASDAVEQMRKAIAKCAMDSAKHKAIADSAGMALIAYEGGQHCLKHAIALNRNPAMHDLYRQYLDEMSQYFSVFVHYAHVGQAGDGGAWGAIEYTGEPLQDAHKYRALVEWAEQQSAEKR